MKPVEIKPGIFWVGAVDWNLREFHGYRTSRGTTYNCYLILDEKITLIDTVKHHLCDEMISRISNLVDPSSINYIVANHAEMDHSGTLPEILEIAKNAQVITSPNGEKALKRYFKNNWNFHVVKTGDSINIGRHTLQFFLTPMLHWPDSMVTYMPDEKILLPNDAFGQHIATPGRFDDEENYEIIFEEATKYYATIVVPFGEQVKKALDALSALNIEMIAPSHGIIWRSHPDKIIEAYRKWANNEVEDKALIVYDTMWGSTEMMVRALNAGLEQSGVSVIVRSLQADHITEILSDVLRSKAILIGSPTLNNGVLPTVGAFLTSLKGLRYKNRIGFAFGSYGWGGGSIREIEAVINALKWEQPVESLGVQYMPDEEELKKCEEIGMKLGEIIKKKEL